MKMLDMGNLSYQLWYSFLTIFNTFSTKLLEELLLLIYERHGGDRVRLFYVYLNLFIIECFALLFVLPNIYVCISLL